MRRSRQRYRVLTRMYVEPGDEVVLTDRSVETIATLVGKGIIEPVEEESAEALTTNDIATNDEEVTDGD